MKKIIPIYAIIITIVLVVIISRFDLIKSGQTLKDAAIMTQTPSPNLPVKIVDIPDATISPTPKLEESNEWKTFHFNNFHGDTINEVFSFQYPADWHNDSQYFSPKKIEHYDIASTDAPMYYDLISEDLFDSSDLVYQIKNDKRYQPDTVGKIDGKDFRKYDLIDYGAYSGESSGRVIIFVGPKISIKDRIYYLVFRWEEKPLTVTISGNSSEIFQKIVSTLKFKKV